MNRAFHLPQAAALWLVLGVATAGAQAAELKIETRANRSFADVGESGSSFDVSADISVLVTKAGRPVSGLGATVPSTGDEISLPPGWTLESSFLAPFGPVGIGCVFSPTSFQNRGNGLYLIRVVPALSDDRCQWGLGDYQYVVRIHTATVEGSALGVLTIPNTPSVP